MRRVLLLVMILFSCYQSGFCDEIKEVMHWYQSILDEHKDTVLTELYTFYQGSALDENNIVIPYYAQRNHPTKQENGMYSLGKGWGIFRTNNGGITWDTIKKDAYYFKDTSLLFPERITNVFFFDKNCISAVYENSRVCTTTDGGTSWDSTSVYSSDNLNKKVNRYFNRFPTKNDYLVYYYNKSKLFYYTRDGGVTFDSAKTHNVKNEGITCISYNSSKTKLIATFSAGNLLGNQYTDFHGTYATLDLDKKEWEFHDTARDDYWTTVFINDSLGFGIGMVVNILPAGANPLDYNVITLVGKTTNGGKSWSRVYIADTTVEWATGHFEYKEGRIIASVGNGIIYSDDLGENWTYKNLVFATELGKISDMIVLKKNVFLFKINNNLYKYTIEDSTSAINEETDELINVYPNPANNIVNIAANEDITSITLMDMSGLKLNTDNFIAGKNAEIKLTGLASGIYFLNIACGNNTYTRKIVHTEDK